MPAGSRHERADGRPAEGTLFEAETSYKRHPHYVEQQRCLYIMRLIGWFRASQQEGRQPRLEYEA